MKDKESFILKRLLQFASVNLMHLYLASSPKALRNLSILLESLSCLLPAVRKSGTVKAFQIYNLNLQSLNSRL